MPPDNSVLKACQIEIPLRTGRTTLNGDLHVPKEMQGVVIFSHGSGSSRHSPRNRFVARVLQEAGFATLMFDLLTEAEERLDTTTAQLRFDIDLLASRLMDATEWLAGQPEFDRAKLGYFGASTGAAAALVAAAERSGISAVVSRGGRPYLAGPALERVHAPVLLIVGEEDHEVLRLNRSAALRLGGENQLSIVPGATHLFEEPGALEQAAQMARQWFQRFLGSRNTAVHAA